MTPTHRIRRLTWRARAPTPADAFALRALLRERGDAVQEALSRADPALQVARNDVAKRLDPVIAFIETRDVGKIGSAGMQEGFPILDRDLLKGLEAVRDEAGTNHVDLGDPLAGEGLEGLLGDRKSVV